MVPSNAINPLSGREHHGSVTDNISDSMATFGTIHSIQTQAMRVKRDTDDVSGAMTSPANQTPSSFLPMTDANATETESELSETTKSIAPPTNTTGTATELSEITMSVAPTTELRWSSELLTEKVTLASSPLTITSSAVPVTVPTKTSETTTTKTTDQSYATEITTPFSSACPEISKLNVSEERAGEIQISWNLVPQNATNFRNVCMEVISIKNTFCKDHRLRCVNKTTKSGTISDLCHFSNYTVSVSLECDNGNWTKRTENFATRTAVPTKPTNLTNGEVTNTTIALKWSLPDSPNGIITNYTVYWETTSGSKNWDTSQGRAYIVRDLKPYTTYSISVSAWTEAGESNEKEGPLIIDTKEGIPSEPVKLENGTVTNTTVVLKWSPPSSPNGKITNYTVYWMSSDSESSDTTRGTSYTIQNLDSYTNYTIFVSAWTSVGESLKRAGPLRIETKQGIPDPPQNVSVRGISNTTITLQWFRPNISRGEITKYSVYWKKSDSRGNYESKVTTETILELNDLMPYTNYSLKVTAWTDVGEGAASEEVTQQTLEGIPDPPETIVFTEVWNTTMTLEWLPPSITKGVITNYSVYWKKSDTTENYKEEVTEQRAMQLKDLKPFTNYTVKVSAWTAVGEGLASEDQIIETKEGIPGQPFNLTVREGTNVSMDLSWLPPEHPNGKILKYHVSWSFPQKDKPVKKTAATNKTSIFIGDLTPYVNYSVSVSAWTVAGEGASSIEKYQTDVGVPSKPQNLSITNVASKVLILSWDQPQEPRGPIEGYIFNWEAKEESSICEDMRKGPVSTYEVKNLKPFTNYTLWVTPFNKNRKNEILRSETSGMVEAQTAEGIPSSPRDFRVEAFTNTTFDVTWQGPETPNGIVLFYTVYWQSANGYEDTIHANTSDTRYVISNLNSFTKYSITVSATTAGGEGDRTTATVGKTDVGVPSVPRNGTVSYVDDESIFVQWKKPEFQQGPIDGFFVCWRKYVPDDGSNATASETCHNLRPPVEELYDDFNIVVTELLDDQNVTEPFCQYNITSLDPWTNYSIEIKAYNKNQNKNVLKGPAEVILQQTAAAVPEQPILDAAIPVSSTAVIVNWRYTGRYPGPLIYAIYVETRGDECTANDRRNITNGLGHEEARIAGLRPFTNYDFRVFASTPAGSSLSQKTITVRTKPDVPEMPKNVRLNCSYSPTKASVSWSTPDTENGVIEKYKIIYKDKGHSYEKVVNVDNPKLCFKQRHVHELENLHPEISYEISVTGKTRETRGYGQLASSNEKCILPAGVPPFPKNTTLPDVTETNQQEATFTFSNTTFSTEMGEIRYYALIVGFSRVIGKPTNGSVDEAQNQKLPVWNQFWKQTTEIYQATPENWNPFNGNDYDPMHCQRDSYSDDLLYCIIGWEKNCSEEEPTYCNGPLKPGTRYGIKLRGFTRGGFSETSPVFISTVSIETSSPTGIIVGLLLLFFLLIVTATAIVFDRRNNYKMMKRIRNFLWKKDSSTPGRSQDIEINDTGTITNAARIKPMDFAAFLEHVKVMMSDSFLRFSLEYEEIKQNSPKHPCTAAELEENRAKNRWMNIFPFDHSRVKLLPIDDEPSSDYINANYIPGFTSHREYIATQGPLPNTVDDFWRMVWEQSVTMIVMLTQCVERGKKKCEQYWPSDSDNVYYGDLKIQLKSESILSSYCIRIFDLQLGTKQHTVKQMHFTKWPDFGSPESPEDLINFVHAVRDHLPHTNTGPILVHCSAGVGRTGTFMAVDRLLQHIQYYNEINIYNTVVEMRHYRTNMVQTEDQYIYIHKCMRDIISQRLHPRASIYDEDGDELYSNIDIKTTEL